MQFDAITFFPWLRRPQEFTEADSSGSFSVHHDIAIHGLSSGLFKSLNISTDRLNVIANRHAIEAIVRSVQALPLEVASRIRVQSLVELRKQNQTNSKFLGIGKVSEFQELQGARSIFSPHLPLVLMNHAVWFPGLSSTFTSINIYSRPGDTIVCSSMASLKATEDLLSQVRENVKRSLNLDSVNLASPKCVLSPLAVDDKWLEAIDKEIARQLLDISADALVLLYFGRISKEYKADLLPLLLVLKKVVKKFPKALLIIAGSDVHSGPATSVENEALRLGVRDHVKIVKNVSSVQKKALYCCADVFVSPADNIVESFGLTLLEAMASGLPVVASDWSGYREIVRQGQTGFLVETAFVSNPFEDASRAAEIGVTPNPEFRIAQSTILDVESLCSKITELLSNKELRDRFGENGRSVVREEYLWSKAMNRLGEVCEHAYQESIASEQITSRSLCLKHAFGHYASSVFPANASLFLATTALLNKSEIDEIVDDYEICQFLHSISVVSVTLDNAIHAVPRLQLYLGWLLKMGVVRIGQSPIIRAKNQGSV